MAPINRKNCVEIFVSAAAQCAEHPTLTIVVPEVSRSPCFTEMKIERIQKTPGSKSAYVAKIDKMDKDPPSWVMQTMRRRLEAQNNVRAQVMHWMRECSQSFKVFSVYCHRYSAPLFNKHCYRIETLFTAKRAACTAKRSAKCIRRIVSTGAECHVQRAQRLHRM